MKSSSAKPRTRVAYFGLLLILLIGGGLRLYRLEYGLPYLYDPDEPLFVNSAIHILRERDLNPHFFGPPATTTIYMLTILYGGIFATGRLMGDFNGVSDFVELYRVDPTILYYSGRLISALFGIATILLVFIIARRIFNKKTAYIAALLIGISPVHVQYSQLVRMDVQLTVFLLVACWFSLEIIQKAALKDYLLSGTFLGLAVTTKFPGIVFALSILLAHLFTKPSDLKHHTKVLASVGAFLSAVFISSPFLFLDYQNVLKDILFEARSSHLGATSPGFAQNLVWYVSYAFPKAISAAGLFLAGLGIVLSIFSKQRNKLLFIVFPLSFLLFISMLNLRWVRWIIPIIPFLCIFCAFGIDQLTHWFAKHVHLHAGWGVGIVLTVVTLVPMCISNFQQVKEASGNDTRTIARQWIIDNIPVNSILLMELYGPQLPKERYVFHYVTNKGVIIKLDPSLHASAIYRPIGGWSDRFAYLKRIEDIQDEGIQYIVLSNFYDRYIAERQVYTTEIATYEEIMRLGSLIYETEPVKGVNKGPKIRIYQTSAKNTYSEGFQR
jgi:hypothetical protein